MQFNFFDIAKRCMLEGIRTLFFFGLLIFCLLNLFPVPFSGVHCCRVVLATVRLKLPVPYKLHVFHRETTLGTPTSLETECLFLSVTGRNLPFF